MLKLIFVLFFWSCADNPDKIVAESDSAYFFSIDDLDAFNADTEKSNLIESVILVKGFVEDINYLNNRQTIILKGTKASKKLIICDMQDNQKEALKNLNLGQKVSIKGLLKGTLNDVILLNCIISN